MSFIDYSPNTRYFQHERKDPYGDFKDENDNISSNFSDFLQTNDLNFSQTRLCKSLNLDPSPKYRMFRSSVNQWEAMLTQKGLDSKIICIFSKDAKDPVDKASYKIKQMSNIFTILNLDLGIGIFSSMDNSHKVTQKLYNYFLRNKVNGAREFLEIKGQNAEILSKNKIDCQYALLGIAEIYPLSPWRSAKNPLKTTKEIMNTISDKYKRNLDRVAVSKFCSAMANVSVFIRNRDQPTRSPNSRKTNHSLTGPALNIIRDGPPFSQGSFFKDQKAAPKNSNLRTIQINMNSESFKLSSGEHNELQKKILEHFFQNKYASLLYIGDTAGLNFGQGRKLILKKNALSQLEIRSSLDGVLPDILIYYPEENTLKVIEAYHCTGAIDAAKMQKFSKLFREFKGIVHYITALSNRKKIKSVIQNISWGTSVWIASEPNHMIHFK